MEIGSAPTSFIKWTERQQGGWDDDGCFVDSDGFSHGVDHDNYYECEKIATQFPKSLTLNVSVMAHRPVGRQARKPARRVSGGQKKAACVSSEGEGEPPRSFSFYPAVSALPAAPISQLYSYKSVAQLLDCAVRTLYNKVDQGEFPRPVQTPVGVRFTDEQVRAVLSGAWKPQKPKEDIRQPQTRPRGRPRIALLQGKKRAT
jgi:predicted DNA-binding transcriptional regulator AlpA